CRGLVVRFFLSGRSGHTRGVGAWSPAGASADLSGPAMARVMVNRIWLHHFGKGLVTTPSDFGLRSDPPSHPELLDYLAWRFMEEIGRASCRGRAQSAVAAGEG